MVGKKLRVLARGDRTVFDLERHEAGIRRYVGRKHDRTLGVVFTERDAGGTDNQHRQGGWPASHKPAEPDELPYRAEYLFAIRDGDLWAADKETADICGVAFDPTFGGEYDVAPVPSSLPAALVRISPPVKE